jgi:HAD superfamily hydrolase (TIGR01509 family)
MQQKYSVIVFDLGNVLIPFNYDLVIKKFNEVSKGLGEKFLNFYKENYYIHRQFERGEISEDDFIDKMLFVLEHKVDKEKFCRDYSALFTVNEDVADLLPLLKEKYKLILLSNTNPIHRKYGWNYYDFLKYFDKLILSYEVGAYKPEEKIYKAAEAFSQKPPQEHLFIDDVAEYVQGAKNIGWDGIQFSGYYNLLNELNLRNIF